MDRAIARFGQLVDDQLAASAASAQNQQWNGRIVTPGYPNPQNFHAGSFNALPTLPQYPVYPGSSYNPGVPVPVAANLYPGGYGQYLQPSLYPIYPTPPAYLPYPQRPNSAPMIPGRLLTPTPPQQVSPRPGVFRDHSVDALTNKLQNLGVAAPSSAFPAGGNIYYPETEPNYHSFRLTPLPRGAKCFRLVEFAPVAGPQSPISCKLLVADLENHPEYIALSYPVSVSKVSKRFRRLEQISCNNGHIEVYGGMLDILHTILDPYDPVYLWIDCFCISPRDPAEKAEQIAMMKYIYRNAKETVIWLEHPGDNAQQVGAAFESLKICYTHYNDIKTRQAFMSKFASTFAFINTVALGQLLQKTYFSRTWMLQEAALSSHAVIYCCTYRVSWSEFCQQLYCIMKIGYLNHIIERHPHPLTLDYNYVWGGRHMAFVTVWVALENQRKAQIPPTESLPLKLKQLMRLTRSMNASDLRDRVYALLGLCSDGHEITVHTNKDYTVATLYHQLALYLTTPRSACCNCTSTVCPEKELSILGDAGIRDWNHSSFKEMQAKDKLHLQTLPSWVPVWDYSRPKALWSTSHTAKHKAGGETRPTVWHDPDSALPRNLFVSGIITSRILHITTPCPILVDNAAFMQLNDLSRTVNRIRIIGTWFSEAFTLLQKYVNASHSRTEDFCLTLCANSSPLETDQLLFDAKRLPVTNSRELVRAFKDYMELYAFAESHKLLPDFYTVMQSQKLKNHGQGARTWEGVIGSTVLQRTFFIADDGRMGLAPGLTRRGDEVCVFAGAPMPIVLRPATRASHSGGGQYQIVGDAYVHGLMNGEAFEQFPAKEDLICLV